jgi:hypothetical protein
MFLIHPPKLPLKHPSLKPISCAALFVNKILRMKSLLLYTLSLALLNITIAQAPTSGLVAYYPLDGNYTNTISGSFNGSNFGSVATTNKNNVANRAMAFSNTNTNALIVGQYATIPITTSINFTGSQNFTVSFYALFSSPYIHAAGLFDNCLNYGGYGCFFWNANGFPQIVFNYKNGSAFTPNGAVPLDTWLQICLVRENGATKIYINGALVVTSAEGSAAQTYNFSPRIGSMFFNSYTPPQYNGHNGKIDDLRIYNRVLSLAEMATLLPIKLNSFSAKLFEDETQLNWQTAQEINTSHFEIERSVDGINFMKVGSENASGNSSNTRDYMYYDKLPATVQSLSKIYYRLKSVDVDGRFIYSDIVTILLNKKMEQLFVFPNPAKEKINIQTTTKDDGKGLVQIIDMNGKMVFKKEINLTKGSNAFNFDIGLLRSGNYFLKLQLGTEIFQKGFVKLE